MKGWPYFLLCTAIFLSLQEVWGGSFFHMRDSFPPVGLRQRGTEDISTSRLRKKMLVHKGSCSERGVTAYVCCIALDSMQMTWPGVFA